LSAEKVAVLEAQERQKRIGKLSQERMIEYDRYYQTVLLTIGFKKHLETKATDCRFISAEPCFRNSYGAEIRPDMVLQHDGKQGVLCEVKTSFPFRDEHLLNTLRQLEKYSQPVIGWETQDRMVDYHDIALFCHAFDFDRVFEKLKQWIDDGTLKVSNNLCLCEWMMGINPKTAKEELLIRLRNGKTTCEELNLILKKNINIDIQQLVVEVEKCKFTRKEPPVEYTMVQLWMHIFSEINNKPEDFDVSTDELLSVVYDYYIPWSNIGGEYSQVRESWIKKAMQGFCDIGLADEIHDVDKANTYKILKSRSVPKNIQEYIIERLCVKAVDAKISKKPIVEINENITRITDFFDKSHKI
jgi:hypothetical protein